MMFIRGKCKVFFRITEKYIIKYINKPRSLHVVNITITIAHGEKLVGRFYHIDHGCSNKNLRFPCTCMHFFLVSCNVCPVAIPKLLPQTQGSDSWQLIH